VATAARQHAPVWTEGERVDVGGVPREGVQLLPTRRIPQFDDGLGAAARHCATVGRDRERVSGGEWAGQRAALKAARGVEDFDRLITTAAGERLAVGAQGDGVRPDLERPQLLYGRHVPYIDAAAVGVQRLP